MSEPISGAIGQRGWSTHGGEPIANPAGQRALCLRGCDSRSGRPGERGGTLFLTCMLLLIGAILLTGLFGLAAADYRAVVASMQSTQVRYISEAGIFRAIAKLNAESAWRDGWQSVSFGAGTFTVRIEETSGFDGGAANSRTDWQPISSGSYTADSQANSQQNPTSGTTASQTDTKQNQTRESSSQSEQTAPRLVTIYSEAWVPPRAKHIVRVVYDLQQKKIVNWAE